MDVITAMVARRAVAALNLSVRAAAAALRAFLRTLALLTALAQAWLNRAEAKKAELSLSEARRLHAADRWRAAFEAAPLGMAKVGPDGRLEAVNSAFSALLGEPERAVTGRRLNAFVYPDDLEVLEAATGKAEVRMVCAGGRLRWCELASSVVQASPGEPGYTLVNVVDITHHKRSQAALRDLATRDPLSGLANRRWFEVQLAQHVRLCSEQGPRGALLVLDLDNFKAVNDTLGHQAGDRLVIEVAVTLRRHLRDKDVIARLGGDEFAVVLRDGDRRAAEAVARKLVLAVRDEVLVAAAGALEVTVSVGVAPFDMLALVPSHDVVAAGRGMVRAADTALYSVKASGRNGYSVAGSPEGPHHARRRVADLTAASERASGERTSGRAPGAHAAASRSRS
ncbi:MAG TPA: diguanylate cyclase [Acidimicrobiales bacterium]|nr:diguanylate cyclase [Acidimicrobiales bacterium]